MQHFHSLLLSFQIKAPSRSKGVAGRKSKSSGMPMQAPYLVHWETGVCCIQELSALFIPLNIIVGNKDTESTEVGAFLLHITPFV